MSSDHDLSPQPPASTTPATPATSSGSATPAGTWDPSGLPAGAAVAGAVAALRQVDVSVRAAVAAVQGLDGGRVVVEEGMSTEAALRLHTGAAPADVAMVLSAAEVLAGMPVAAGLFARGVLSWGHVRALVAGAGRLDVATRADLDRHLDDHRATLEAMDGDRRLWAIDDAIAHHSPLRRLERAADTEPDRSFFSLQGRLDGTATCYGQWDREAAALLADALHAEADAPQAPACPTDSDSDSDGGGGFGRPPVRSRAGQLADALLRLIDRGRDGGGGRPTGPVRFTVVVDADQVTDRAGGQLQTALRGRPPRIVRQTLERLACDAAIDAVVRDGVDLLAAQRYAPEVTAATRRAVAARDGGCRLPGCTAPVAWCDIHHLKPRAAGGDHAIGNLVLLCRRHHSLVHRRGWQQHLDPDGTYTLQRHGRRWRSLPRTTTTLPPPTPADPNRPSRDGPTRAGPGDPSGPARGDPARAGPSGPARGEPVPAVPAGFPF